MLNERLLNSRYLPSYGFSLLFSGVSRSPSWSIRSSSRPVLAGVFSLALIFVKNTRIDTMAMTIVASITNLIIAATTFTKLIGTPEYHKPLSGR